MLKAISKVDAEGIPKEGDSQYYDVVYNGKRYPPKVLVSYANLFANGEILDRSTFEGGIGTEAFKLLEHEGFSITRKGLGIAEKLRAFADVYQREFALHHTSDLTSYKILVNDLPVDIKNALSVHKPTVFFKGSIGQGTNTYYPWIGIFDRKVSSGATNGFYVVLLFSDDLQDIYLTLNQGSTMQTREQTEAYKNFVFSHYPRVEGFEKGRLPEHGLTKTKSGTSAKNGRKYEDTNIFYRKYSIATLNEDDFIVHLKRIVEVYFDCADKYSPKSTPPRNPEVKFTYEDFYEATKNAGLTFSDELILRFVSALLTKPFVILTGLSGSGKTKLAQAFAMWLCENEEQYCLVPIGADWTNREPLLGFPNALEFGKYVKPDNRVLDLLIKANEQRHKPFFIILDEMNLSHVERYFADFLSAMESKTKIALHSGADLWGDVPAQISIPENLFIIGTVNIDETTYMFSPKVLDRASVIEFRVTADEMSGYLEKRLPLTMDNLKGQGSSQAENFVQITKDVSLEPANADEFSDTLMVFFAELKKIGAEFAYRSASEMRRFVAIVSALDTQWPTSQILDAAIMQKLLPKIHGSQRRLQPVLKSLGTLCLNDGENIEDYFAKSEINGTEPNVKYPVSLEKILRMYQNLISNGFTSYAEA